MAKNQEIQPAGQELVRLPSIEELYGDENLELLAKQNDLNVLLNQLPKQEWIRTNKYAGNSLYIPINRLEWLMTRIFINWHTEVKSISLLANSIAVTVRVHYFDPTSGEWKWTDGVGASGLQVDKGEKASDFQALKSNAVEMGLPKAKTEAVKDAIGDLGRLFGRDLNRKDSPDYNSMYGRIEVPIEAEELVALKARLLDCKEGYEIELLGFFGIDSLEELPKSKLNAANMRITSHINHRANEASKG